MIGKLVSKLFGSRNDRVIRRLQAQVDKITALEPSMQALSDTELQAKTKEFRQRLADGASVDSLLSEAFAVVRETSVRTLGMRPFDVQLIGGIVLHQGNISEMRTGEGKTLMSTLPVYLNALSGKGVHLVTINDYLAERDAKWMQPIYDFLGLTVGVVIPNMEREAKQAAYQADITYGTNNEFGFDYLRDNMAFDLDEKAQRELHFAIVDEVDSILVDEARTPLIISGAAEDSSELYRRINQLIPKLKKQENEEDPGDYTLDEKSRQAYLTEAGHQSVEKLLAEAGLVEAGESLYSASNINLMHHINAALRGHTLYHLDVDYIVQDNEIVIVDEHTGRTMPGRRWSEGLHQAVEAKEKVKIQNENQTLASITFQNYFRQYDKLSGMTGTADTEAYEFHEIYNLEVLVIPTNKPMIRDDRSDYVYLTQEEKFTAILEDIKDCQQRGQPALVGTASIETSEYVSTLLQKADIKHQVLNAKFHAKEAQIIADAGRPGAVTIATNMAGRGTDIVLGGAMNGDDDAEWQQRHQEVLDAGGLHIVGSERHESRRIDNQLRGRSGRQGDPGSSRFYLSLEDNLMRIFASERVAKLMEKLGMGQGEPIEHPWVNKAIENAQRKVEGYNFDIRKQLLEYDNVSNDQRQIIYGEREQLLSADNMRETIDEFRAEIFNDLINEHMPPQSLEEQWNIPALEAQLTSDFGLQLPLQQWLKDENDLNEELLRERILQQADDLYKAKCDGWGEDITQHLEQSITLQCLDNHWREHLAAMDHLRQGIHLRGYAQKDPKQEYKREAFTLFHSMLEKIKYTVASLLSTVEVQEEDEVSALDQQRRVEDDALQFQHPAAGLPGLEDEEFAAAQAGEGNPMPITRDEPKTGRNEPCHCGSGRKFKHCHGRL